MPIVRKWIKGPMWLHFLVGVSYEQRCRVLFFFSSCFFFCSMHNFCGEKTSELLNPFPYWWSYWIFISVSMQAPPVIVVSSACAGLAGFRSLGHILIICHLRLSCKCVNKLQNSECFIFLLGECLQVALYQHWHSLLHLHTEQQSIRLSHQRHKRITKCKSLQHLLCKTHSTAFTFVHFLSPFCMSIFSLRREALGVNTSMLLKLT